MSDYNPTPRLRNEIKTYDVPAPRPMTLTDQPIKQLRRAMSPIRHIRDLPTKELLFLNKDTVPNFNYANIQLPIAEGCVLVQTEYTLFSSKIDLNYYLNSVDSTLNLSNSLTAASYTKKSLGRMFFGEVAEGSRHADFRVGDKVCGVYYHLDADPAMGTLNTFLVVDPAKDPIFTIAETYLLDSAALFEVDDDISETGSSSSNLPSALSTSMLLKNTKLYRKLAINYSLWALHYCYSLQILSRHADNFLPSTSFLVINSPTEAKTKCDDLVEGVSLSDILVSNLKDLYHVTEICSLSVNPDGAAPNPHFVKTFTFNLQTDDKVSLYNELQGYLNQSRMKFNYIINMTNPAALPSIISFDRIALLLAPKASGSGLISVAYGYDAVTKPNHPVSATTAGGSGDSKTWAGWFANATTLVNSPLLYNIYSENMLDLTLLNKKFPTLSTGLLPAKFTEFYNTHVSREIERLKAAKFCATTVRHYDWQDFRDVFTKLVSGVRGKSGKKAVNVDDDDRRILFKLESF
ncbi:hypothetical protein BABINDRAFT_161494 [Babjeviella inositovora NRRL Y-12698]|uniref:Uncharacterized protein n=1 Tax=Babjeviella inositovora NRRL Y-12698 TaxID=984486 RepID=A0A1E3QQ64_9ASCO|nr:uncharacterized protein BABINDRAFT_161494 [Babjeviella inositovora NRRL Y-12698]ODQ79800.1 hypothetical protein BABINDRAFT_161494 [Babjeviella inositovora NRRL Y-12698]